MKITVMRRRNDYMAFVSGNNTIYEIGSTEEIAIGKLIISLSRRGGFQVEVERWIELNNEL